MIPNDRPQAVSPDQLRSGLHDLAAGCGPDYRDDILGRVARTRQRPAWAFLERWIPMPIALRLAVVPRALVILLLLLGLLLAMTLAVYTVGSRPLLQAAVALPPPTGLAGNGLIAYDSAGDIWLAEADGSDPRQLTSGSAIDSAPVWSPDGTRLAYWTQEERGSPSSLVHVRPDGTDPMTVATDPFGQVPWRTDWSPDGTQLAYSICIDAGGSECSPEFVFVAAADGSGAVQVGDPELSAGRPDWSPDGALLAFQGKPGSGSPGVYVMAPDGSGVRRLEDLPDGDDFNAFVVDWAPDGSGIVTQAGTPAAIWVASPDGSPARELGSGGMPWWSPDGAWIAYLEDMSRLAVVSADGQEARDLAVASASGITWSPDATRLLGMRGSGTVLVIVDVATGERIAEITGLDQSYPNQTHFASWQRVAP